MGSETNDNHSDNLWSIVSGIIYFITMQKRTTNMRTMVRAMKTTVMLTMKSKPPAHLQQAIKSTNTMQ